MGMQRRGRPRCRLRGILLHDQDEGQQDPSQRCVYNPAHVLCMNERSLNHDEQQVRTDDEQVNCFSPMEMDRLRNVAGSRR